jgi:hypothetical protein
MDSVLKAAGMLPPADDEDGNNERHIHWEDEDEERDIANDETPDSPPREVSTQNSPLDQPEISSAGILWPLPPTPVSANAPDGYRPHNSLEDGHSPVAVGNNILADTTVAIPTSDDRHTTSLSNGNFREFAASATVH